MRPKLMRKRDANTLGGGLGTPYHDSRVVSHLGGIEGRHTVIPTPNMTAGWGPVPSKMEVENGV